MKLKCKDILVCNFACLVGLIVDVLQGSYKLQYMHIPQNISLVKVSPVGHLLVFNILHTHICPPVCFLAKVNIGNIFVQKVNTTFLTNQHECKLYMLLHIKQLFVNKLIHCLVIRKQCFKNITS